MLKTKGLDGSTPLNGPRSIFRSEPLSDFIHSLVKRVKSCVKALVVKEEDVSGRQKPENPVVRFHINQCQLNEVTDTGNRGPQDVHRIPPPEKRYSSRRSPGIEACDVRQRRRTKQAAAPD